MMQAMKKTQNQQTIKKDDQYSLSSMHDEDGDLDVNAKENVNENLYTMSQGYNDRFVADILAKACTYYKSFRECKDRSRREWIAELTKIVIAGCVDKKFLER